MYRTHTHTYILAYLVLCVCIYAGINHILSRCIRAYSSHTYTHICIWVYLSDGTNMKKKKRGGMSPKGDDNDNRLLLLNAKPYDDDVSIGEKALAYLHIYIAIKLSSSTHIYHRRWVITTCVTDKYSTVSLSLSFSLIIELHLSYISLVT